MCRAVIGDTDSRALNRSATQGQTPLSGKFTSRATSINLQTKTTGSRGGYLISSRKIVMRYVHPGENDKKRP